MTKEALEEVLEAAGGNVLDIIRAIFDPEEDTSRAAALVTEMMELSGDYNRAAAGKLETQDKKAIISRVLIGAMDKADDHYMPLKDIP